jgi:hypothetical protein
MVSNLLTKLSVQEHIGFRYTVINKKYYKVVHSSHYNGEYVMLMPIISLEDELIKVKAKRRLQRMLNDKQCQATY